MYLFRPPNIPIVFPIFIFRSQIQYHYHFLFIGLKKKSLEAANGINREVASHFFIRSTASNLVSKITTKKSYQRGSKGSKSKTNSNAIILPFDRLWLLK